jgi:hypothetical protein
MLSEYEMFAHLAKKGFMSNDHLLHQHGEVLPTVADESDGNDDVDRMDDMVADIGRGYDLESKDPPLQVQNFYRLLAASVEKVHDGTDVTVLQVLTRLMGFKSNYNFSNQCYNDIVKLIIDLIPVKHNIPKDLYQSKMIVSSFGMDYEKIDVCEKNCMLFWKEHTDDTECTHYGTSRYVKVINEDGASITTKVVVKQLHYIPTTPRLKQLFLCEETVQQMRWHKERIRNSKDPSIMSHPADGEAWHALDHFDPAFIRDPRSAGLVLSMDGFHPYSSDSTVYSCWPVFVMPYNLPSNKCLKERFIFLTLVIPGPKELRKQMNICFAFVDGRAERAVARGRCI